MKHYTNMAKQKAENSRRYLEAFSEADWNSTEPWPHRRELAQALDYIDELSRVVLDLSKQVDSDYTIAAFESDPNGKGAHEPGAKLDQGKNRLGLVMFGFARALQAVGEVGTYGANKYTDNGWMEVLDGERRYTDAMLRHLMREAIGEERDHDTGLRHAAHAAWNALARLDLLLRKASNV